MMTGTFDLGRVTGFSAYEVWKAQPGNENKTEQDFLKFISSGGDWIDFDTTPIDFDSVRTYRTYGSTTNLDTDLTRGSVPGDALSAEFSPGTFMFESHSCRNNLKKSTEYDTIQTMTLFSGSANPDEFAKYVRYGIFDEDGQTFTVQADWTMSGQFIDNEHMVSKAFKLARTFNLKIAGVTKPVDGSQNVEFTKEELGLSEGGSSENEYYFEQIFEGYVPKTTLKIKDDIKDGLVFLVQLAPRVKTNKYGQLGWAGGDGRFPYINRYRYLQPSASPNSDIGMNSLNLADYSLCFLLTSVPMNKETTQSNAYVSASQSNAYGYTATEKVEFLHTKQRVEQLLYDGNSAYPKGNSVVLTLLGWEDLTSDGGFYVDIESISDFGYANTKPFITRIWKLTKK